ncbi:MAG: DUF3800 domain-containing protein [bacterium]|nr:DUF3800 domain-containing protein [bacterium]
MIIFIDESGTHKQVDHSTIALVYVEVENLEVFEKAIVDIEEKLKIKYFHWTDEKWEKREKFIEQLIKLDFFLKVAILKNPIRLSKSLEEALKHLVVEENIKKIVLDGRKPKWYSQGLKKVLRDKGVSVKKIVTVRKEESSPGVRVADCLAGLIRSYYDNPNNLSSRLYKKLKKTEKIKFELTTY